MLMERDHFQQLKPNVWLSSSHKYIIWKVYCIFICLLCDLYCSEVGRFRVGVGLSPPIKVYIYIMAGKSHNINLVIQLIT